MLELQGGDGVEQDPSERQDLLGGAAPRAPRLPRAPPAFKGGERTAAESFQNSFMEI